MFESSNDSFDFGSGDVFDNAAPLPVNPLNDPLSAPRVDLSTGNPALAGAAAVALVTPVITRNAEQPGNSVSTAKVAEPATPSPSAPEKVVPAKNIFARRRSVAIGTIVALSFGLWSGTLRMPGSVPGAGVLSAATPGAPSTQTSATAAAVLGDMLNKADAIKASTGTYRNITFPSDVQSMKSDNMLVLSMVVQGSCWFAVSAPGISRVARWDPTAMRCNLDRGQVPTTP